MKHNDTQDLYALANDTVDSLSRMGELEGYLVFLWQELELLDPQRWTNALRIDIADLKERMEDSD